MNNDLEQHDGDVDLEYVESIEKTVEELVSPKLERGETVVSPLPDGQVFVVVPQADSGKVRMFTFDDVASYQIWRYGSIQN